MLTNMKRAGLAALVVVLLLATVAVAQDEAIVNTQSGAVRGIVESNFRVFKVHGATQKEASASSSLR